MSLKADVLVKYLGTPVPSGEDLSFWFDLVDEIGYPQLEYLLSEKAHQVFPYGKLGYSNVDVGRITPGRGEVWILFAYRGTYPADSVLDTNGFLMICEWVKDSSPCTRLPKSLLHLAEVVKRQFGGDGWNLHPSYSRYGDDVDFSDEGIFTTLEDGSWMQSAWGSLASGLKLVQSGIVPSEWPFSSMQTNPEGTHVAPVAALDKKLQIARQYHASHFYVASSQLSEASAHVPDGIKLIGVNVNHSLERAISEIAFGTERSRKRRRTFMLRISAVVSFLMLLGMFVYFGWFYPRIEYYADCVPDVDNVYRGVIPLDEESAKGVLGVHRFTWRGHFGGLVKIDVLDGLKIPSNYSDIQPVLNSELSIGVATMKMPHNRAISLEFSKGSFNDRDIIYATGRNIFGQAVYIQEIVNGDGFSRYSLMDAEGKNIVSGDVAYVMSSMEDGVFVLRNYGADNKPAKDILGAYMHKRTYEVKGDVLVGRTTLCGRDGEPIRSKLNFATYRCERQAVAPGRIVKMSFEDEHGNYVKNHSNGIAVHIFTYSMEDRHFLVKNYGYNEHYAGKDRDGDLQHQLCVEEHKISNDFLAFDVRGMSYFGTGEFERHFTFHANGLPASSTFSQRQGTGRLSMTEKYEYSGEYGQRLNVAHVIEEASGKKYEFETLRVFNKKGNLILQRTSPESVDALPSNFMYMDLVLGKNAAWNYVRRNDIWCILTTHFLIPGKEQFYRSPNIANCKKEYVDGFGRVRRTEWYDIDAEGNEIPVEVCVPGGPPYHREERDYIYGLPSKFSNYGKDNELIDGEFPAEITYEYDSCNRVVSRIYHRGKERKALPNGVWKTLCTYSGNNRIHAFYDINGNLIPEIKLANPK